MRWFAVVLLVAGCGQKARPAPPPTEIPITGIATFAGEWVADDEMSWSYRLSIKPDGTLAGMIDRGKLPRCEREGTLAAGAAANQFVLAMRKNTCEQAIAHAGTAQFEVTSYTGDTLSVVVTVDGTPERRTYKRRPS